MNFKASFCAFSNACASRDGMEWDAWNSSSRCDWIQILSKKRVGDKGCKVTVLLKKGNLRAWLVSLVMIFSVMNPLHNCWYLWDCLRFGWLMGRFPWVTKWTTNLVLKKMPRHVVVYSFGIAWVMGREGVSDRSERGIANGGCLLLEGWRTCSKPLYQLALTSKYLEMMSKLLRGAINLTSVV